VDLNKINLIKFGYGGLLLPQKIMLASKDVKSYWLIIISHLELGPSLSPIEPNFQKLKLAFWINKGPNPYFLDTFPLNVLTRQSSKA
jgi:hypothetical protein